jgi:hypothetical protein
VEPCSAYWRILISVQVVGGSPDSINLGRRSDLRPYIHFPFRCFSDPNSWRTARPRPTDKPLLAVAAETLFDRQHLLRC